MVRIHVSCDRSYIFPNRVNIFLFYLSWEQFMICISSGGVFIYFDSIDIECTFCGGDGDLKGVCSFEGDKRKV